MTYLGDGLYASYDGYQIRLYADRGEGGEHEVFLDADTLEAFLIYVKQLIQETRKRKRS
jgi:hypothetical protein